MIGEHIKSARKFAGLTQEQLGQAIGISGVAIMRYEKGQREPSKEIIEKIATALKASPTDIMGWDCLDERAIKEGVQFIEYLESIGYRIQDDLIAIEWEENHDGSKYPVMYDESPDSPCCTLIRDEIVSSFTNQQFNDFQKSMISAAELYAYKYRNI